MVQTNWLVRTFRCQMNERDTETIKGLLAEEGYGFIQ